MFHLFPPQSDDEMGSTAATDGSTLRTSPAEQGGGSGEGSESGGSAGDGLFIVLHLHDKHTSKCIREVRLNTI